MSVPDTVRHGSAKVIFESYPIVGFNYRMTDIQAAVGREQLKRLPGDRRAPPRDRRRATASCCARSPGIALPTRARLGAQQLAELLRAPAGALRPARGHAVDARRRRVHAPRHHVQPSRGTVSQRQPVRRARRTPRRRRTTASCCRLYGQMTDDDVNVVAQELRGAAASTRARREARHERRRPPQAPDHGRDPPEHADCSTST